MAGVGVDGPDATVNPTFAEGGGSPFEGQDRPLCDTKLVNLVDQGSIAPLFYYFTDVPIPGKWKGYIIDDLTVSTDNTSLSFGEKAGLPNSPIGIYDFSNQLVTTITSDYNGVYEVLLPSTHTVNCPSPAGVCSAMYYLLGNVEDARDALQEAFVKCWRHRAKLPEIENLHAWVFRVALNAGRDLRATAWRRKKRPLEEREAVLVARDDGPQTDALRRERLELLRRALLELRCEEQEVFLLRQNGCLTYEQIARSIDVPVGTVKTRMRLALTKLREALEGK